MLFRISKLLLQKWHILNWTAVKSLTGINTWRDNTRYVLTLILCTTVLPYPLLINKSLPNFPLGRKAEREDGDQSQKLAQRDGNSWKGGRRQKLYKPKNRLEREIETDRQTDGGRTRVCNQKFLPDPHKRASLSLNQNFNLTLENGECRGSLQYNRAGI